MYEEQKRLERQEAGERNAIEGKFGEGKRRYGLGCVMTRLDETSNMSYSPDYCRDEPEKEIERSLGLFFQNDLFVKIQTTCIWNGNWAVVPMV